MNAKKPEKFYKYHSMNELYSIANLNNTAIYFSHSKMELYKIMIQTAALAQKYDTKNKMSLDSTEKWMQKLFCTKLRCWAYEQEWRIGYPQQDQRKPLKNIFPYKKGDVSSIILGERMIDANKNLIKDIVRWTYADKVELKLARIGTEGVEIEIFKEGFI